jgi:hypothetical protein
MFTLSRPSPATKKWLQASNHHIGRITRKNTKETWINNSSNDNIQDPKMTRKEEADEFERQWQLIVSFHSSDESESDSLSMVAFDDEASLFSSSSSSSSSDTMKKKRKQNRSWKRRFVLVSNYLTLRRKDKVAPARNIIDPELYDITCS